MVAARSDLGYVHKHLVILTRLTVLPTVQVPLTHAIVTRSGLRATPKLPPIYFRKEVRGMVVMQKKS
ncbi:hypothetical protein K443DRAFT_674333 [Laccaria amethystina LaAM-08-1]|uniref:Uncharacterized protein n=1 Tax=Laccaria amethystina LaAM-08-1 TaxID=1095629 RepID=A0A0C9YDS8_9AGAR|nr:hypothetical protein K443DRAFT_674333 [Laccaria amethystina LaAM-08-1]